MERLKSVATLPAYYASLEDAQSLPSVVPAG
jgi:hypothetical protein